MSSWLFTKLIFDEITVMLSYDKNKNSKVTHLKPNSVFTFKFFVQFTFKFPFFHGSNHLAINYDIRFCTFYYCINLGVNNYFFVQILLLWTHILTLISRCVYWFYKIHITLMKIYFFNANYLITIEFFILLFFMLYSLSTLINIHYLRHIFFKYKIWTPF